MIGKNHVFLSLSLRKTRLREMLHVGHNVPVQLWRSPVGRDLVAPRYLDAPDLGSKLATSLGKEPFDPGVETERGAPFRQVCPQVAKYSHQPIDGN